MEDLNEKYNYPEISLTLENTDNYWFRARRDMLLEIIKGTGKKILEVGCGTGFLSVDLAKQGYDVTCIDKSASMVGITKDRAKNAGVKLQAFVYDFQKSMDGTYDSILMADMIEHVRDDESALKNANKALRNGGYLVLSVPSMPSLWSVWDDAAGHYRRYKKGELVKKLENAGFRIEKIRYWNFISIPVVFYYKTLKKTYVYRKSFWHNILYYWFKFIENRVSPPIGVSLIVKAKKINKIDGRRTA